MVAAFFFSKSMMFLRDLWDCSPVRAGIGLGNSAVWSLTEGVEEDMAYCSSWRFVAVLGGCCCVVDGVVVEVGKGLAGG